MNDAERETLERRIDELCAEVEKYRSARDASVDLATKTIDRIRELEAEVERGKAEFKKMDVWHSQELKAAMDENAKLRELVDELYPLADYGAMDASELDRAHDLMRELGVEVDE